jgi:signal transduction histidine kinase
MFKTARVTLTLWYVVLLMSISVIFSIAFYQSSTREIERLITRIELDQLLEESGVPFRLPMGRVRNAPTLEELQEIKQRSLYTLIGVNSFILIVSSGASYLLAGKTLRPIQTMMEEQKEFVSNASHELRTPLATIRAQLEGALLESKISDAKARELITSNLEEVDRLSQLTKNLLVLSRTDAQVDATTPQNVAVQSILQDAVASVKLQSKHKKIEIVVQSSDHFVKVDPSQVIEAIVIVLDNAIKYSPSKSSVTIVARTHGKWVHISITDQGPGIDSSDLSHLFERFYRADKSRSQAEGFGLGLSIAKRLLESNHGSIQIHSQLHHGTTVIMKLPVSVKN